jgi:hypothetical protein
MFLQILCVCVWGGDTSCFNENKMLCHAAIENLSDPIGYLLDNTHPYYTALAGNMKARAKKDN